MPYEGLFVLATSYEGDELLKRAFLQRHYLDQEFEYSIDDTDAVDAWDEAYLLHTYEQIFCRWEEVYYHALDNLKGKRRRAQRKRKRDD